MGYTRYFRLNEIPTKEQTETIKNAVQHILNEHKDIVQFEYDDSSKPLCDYTEGGDLIICFNGVEENGHETFSINFGKLGFEFYKTARKPYDKVVLKVLTIIKAVMEEGIEVSSDGKTEFGETFDEKEFLKQFDLD